MALNINSPLKLVVLTGSVWGNVLYISVKLYIKNGTAVQRLNHSRNDMVD